MLEAVCNEIWFRGSETGHRRFGKAVVVVYHRHIMTL